MVQGNVRCEANPDGLLTRKEGEYLACLELQHVKLEELMRKDEAHWAENLEMVKRQAGEIHE